MIIKSMKIKSAKNSQVFLVELEGEGGAVLKAYAIKNKFNNPNLFQLHSETIVKYGLATNQEIDDNKFLLILKESEYLIALNQATSYLASRLKTTKQLKDYLYLKGYKTDTINKVLEKLTEYNVLNDDYYAEIYVKTNENKLSKKELQNKLSTKGIKKESYENLLEEVSDKDLAVKLAEKFMKNKELTKQNLEKLSRHLSYKGFNYEDIRYAVSTLNVDCE